MPDDDLRPAASCCACGFAANGYGDGSEVHRIAVEIENGLPRGSSPAAGRSLVHLAVDRERLSGLGCWLVGDFRGRRRRLRRELEDRDDHRLTGLPFVLLGLHDLVHRPREVEQHGPTCAVRPWSGCRRRQRPA